MPYTSSKHDAVCLISTYSIIARDGVTGQFGAAVQSHWFNVGSIVPWAEAGVGVVATQSLVETSYGPLGLELMRDGKSATQALAALLAADPDAAVRQVAMIGASVRQPHTPASAASPKQRIETALPRTGQSIRARPNLMRKSTVPAAMALAFEAFKGALVERLVASLRAAQDEGGDIRGCQSAAVLIVRATSNGRRWEDRLVDLRVEDHVTPVDELDRLVRLHAAYDHMNAGDAAMIKKDADAAMREYASAHQLAPDKSEITFLDCR